MGSGGMVGLSQAMKVGGAAPAGAAVLLTLSSDQPLPSGAATAVALDTPSGPTAVVTPAGERFIVGAVLVSVVAPAKVTVEVTLDGTVVARGRRQAVAQPSDIGPNNITTGLTPNQLRGSNTIFAQPFTDDTDPAMTTDATGAMDPYVDEGWIAPGTLGAIGSNFHVELLGTYDGSGGFVAWSALAQELRRLSASYDLGFASNYPNVRLQGTVHSLTGSAGSTSPTAMPWELFMVHEDGLPISPTSGDDFDLTGRAMTSVTTGAGVFGVDDSFDVTIASPGSIVYFFLKPTTPADVPATYDFSGITWDGLYPYLTDWFYPGSATDAAHVPLGLEGGQELRLSDLVITSEAATIGGGGLPTVVAMRVKSRKAVAVTDGQVAGLRVTQDSGQDATILSNGGIGTMLQLAPI